MQKRRITKEEKYTLKEVCIFSILFVAYICLALRSFILGSIGMLLFFIILAVFCLAMVLFQMIVFRNNVLADREERNIFYRLIVLIPDILILLFVIQLACQLSSMK